MVRALLSGTKTQTRRALRIQPPDDRRIMCGPYNPTVIRRGEEEPGPETFGAFTEDGSWTTPCPYGRPGDKLWVREAWRTTNELDKLSGKEIAEACIDAGYHHAWAPFQYEADKKRVNWAHTGKPPPMEAEPPPGRYRHARFMPRWASRITLEITDVHVQRLQEISEADAIAEGIAELVPVSKRADGLTSAALAFAAAATVEEMPRISSPSA